MIRQYTCVLRSFLCAIFIVWVHASALAHKPDSLLYKQLVDYPFVFVSDSIVTTPPVITDSLFDEIARGIRFQVNRTELQAADPFISLYNDSLVPWLKDNNLILREIYVKGAASPEGPYDNNVRLSRERTKRLIEFLSSNLSQPIADRPTNTSFVTEDYAYLVKLMQQAGDKDYGKVKAIWDACKGNERLCKKKLRALNGGRTWRRLVKEYFPTLRQSRMVLWFALNPHHIPVPKQRYYFADKADMQIVPSFPVLPTFSMEPVSTDTVVVAQDSPRRHMIALRTNLLHDFLYVPQFGFAPGANVQLEYYPLSGHYTMNAGFTFTNHRHWDTHKFMQIRDLQLELRRYFKGGGQFIGTFLNAYVEGMVYGIGFGKTKGWEGEGGGAGVGVGHTWALNKRGNLRLEASINFGVFITRYDPYIYSNGNNTDGKYYYDYQGAVSKFKERNHQFVWFGPTNAGLHITYDIIYRKHRKEASR